MTRPSPKRSRLWLIALAALMLMAGAGTGSAVAGDGTGAPSITSDRADYAPGEHVVLTGANWQPGESVDIVVNDDQGETWRHEATVTADGQGEIRDEFDLPQWLVATYSVTAIGEASGTANASFTDGNTFVKNASTTAAGVTVSYRLEKWSNATNCPSSPSPNTTSNFTITGPNAATVSGTSSVASNAGDSVRISMLSATGGNGFDKWQLASGSPTASDGSAFAGGSAVCFNAPSNSSATQTFVGFVKQTAQPPTASAGSDQTVNEGSTVHLDGSGSAGATSYSWTQLSGPTVTLSGATTASPSFTAPNGPATMAFRLSATNAAGSNTDDIQITVNNVPPSVALSGPTSANKHDTKTYTYTISDPGDSRGNISVTESCGANGTRIDTPAQDSFDCSFDHVGSSTVRVTANDGSDTGSDSKTVTIGAVAPTVSMSGATSANEGNTKTYTYTVSDPDATVTESCGANGTRIDTAASNSFDCTFPDGPSTSQVRVSATADGATGFGEKSVAVADVAPQITLSGPDSANEGETKHYSYTVTDPGADTVAVTKDCGAAGSETADGDANPKTFDCSFPDGPASSKVKVSADDGDAGGIATDEIEVAVSNLAPTADAHGPYSGPWGSAISFNGSATDPAGSHDTLSYEWDFDYDGSTFDVDSHVEDPSHSYAGPGTYTAALRVSDEDGGTSAIKTVNVNVAKRSTTLSYTGDGSEQYSDEQTLTAELKDGGQGIQGKTITFTVGTQQVSATTNANGVASTTLLIDQAPGSYTVRTSFAGNGYYTSSYDSDPFTIAKENARAAYTGAEFVSTSSATSSTATVTLAATIRDITAVTGDPDYDSHAGDIRNAKVDFVNVDTGATLCDNLPVGLVNSADPKVGTATCNWTANIGNANSSTFTIGIKVGKSSGRYARDSSTDDTTVTVSKPLNDFITGGGFLVNGSASGQISPTQGQKTNFGFNVKYNKANTNLQGNINAIVRSGAKTYQVKGNSMTSLAANNTTRKATFNGKANIQDITNATNPVSVDGNASLQVTMTDNGDPGSPDTIGITVWNKQGGLWFASKWDGTRTLEQTLGGGNLLVH